MQAEQFKMYTTWSEPKFTKWMCCTRRGWWFLIGSLIEWCGLWVYSNIQGPPEVMIIIIIMIIWWSSCKYILICQNNQRSPGEVMVKITMQTFEAAGESTGFDFKPLILDCKYFVFMGMKGMGWIIFLICMYSLMVFSIISLVWCS